MRTAPRFTLLSGEGEAMFLCGSTALQITWSRGPSVKREHRMSSESLSGSRLALRKTHNGQPLLAAERLVTDFSSSVCVET